MITLYSLPLCIQCRMTKKELDRLGVPFREVDAEQHLDYLKDLGYRSAPVVIVTGADGEVLDAWSGFRPDKLNTLASATAS